MFFSSRRRKWEVPFVALFQIFRVLVLLCVFIPPDCSAVTTSSNNHKNDKYKSLAENNYHQINHQGYGYPSAYHGYSPGIVAAPIGSKQDEGSGLGSGLGGGLSGLISSLTSSLSGIGGGGGGDSGGLPEIPEVDSNDVAEAGSAGLGLGGIALGALTGLLNFTGVTAWGLAMTFLFFMVLGPVIAAGIAVPIVAIVYASIYIPAIGLMDTDVGEFAILNVLPDLIGQNGFKRRTLHSRTIFEAQECVERISCEIGRVGKGNGFGKFVKWAADKSEEKSNSKILKRVARAVKSADSCTKYSCDPVRAVRRWFT